MTFWLSGNTHGTVVGCCSTRFLGYKTFFKHFLFRPNTFFNNTFLELQHVSLVGTAEKKVALPRSMKDKSSSTEILPEATENRTLKDHGTYLKALLNQETSMK